ncbi:MAG: hypothetical protein A3H57_04610 [Candidatus Taylorbacteria bacterium RIFCSPLOWO2_02_FULL_43_11]|uniref:Nudix hydrolase domain-containing protein n=1 Tax=Candidatus Taylorbacteria bacterium RIFCSPHIGHO2_02_FULL_43_32b TaxID=1802306 RepID=A0A1G2MJL4_9BACT|nr:MAG: hypothetical protein A3C72_00130 [Candidatus Taylorbacteria bacterium RIFCSPHIGHO2_02_FULL_43_32b]OHA30033.1 MAG: hypothetical protein A3B08_01020 [Candidatus Taylorbacteria bacterium RIFCSPLOWO2_01_FULL_43_44]OHA35608.1 MAG: hypothetical protein A3H57_04610 [Candidatus Taylorbacteria bacterium RIFCSPLOWO2_02_FULL_43_11]
MKQKNITLQVGVKALIVNPNGEILIIKRNPHKYKEIKQLWDMPGGRIAPGESLISNLEREVEEETNLNLLTKTVTLVAAQDIILEDKHVVRITYLANTTGEIKLDTAENTDYMWVSEETALKMANLDPYLKEILRNRTVLRFA